MHNRSAEPRDYTPVIEALPDKLDIKRHSPGILYLLISYYIFKFVRELVTYESAAIHDTSDKTVELLSRYVCPKNQKI